MYPSLAEVATDIMRIPAPSSPIRMPVGDNRKALRPEKCHFFPKTNFIIN